MGFYIRKRDIPEAVVVIYTQNNRNLEDLHNGMGRLKRWSVLKPFGMGTMQTRRIFSSPIYF